MQAHQRARPLRDEAARRVRAHADHVRHRGEWRRLDAQREALGHLRRRFRELLATAGVLILRLRCVLLEQAFVLSRLVRGRMRLRAAVRRLLLRRQLSQLDLLAAPLSLFALIAVTLWSDRLPKLSKPKA